MKKQNRGIIALPVVVGFVALGLIIGGAWWLGSTGDSDTDTLNTTNPSTQSSQPVKKKHSLIWEVGLSGAFMQALQPNQEIFQAFDLPQGEVKTIKVVSDSAETTVALKSPAGKIISNNTTTTNKEVIRKTIITDPESGRVATLYQITNPLPPTGTTPGTANQNTGWQVVVTNPNTAASTNYTVSLSNPANVTVQTNQNAAVNSQSNTLLGQTASLSITVEETIALNVSVPVLGASVVAVITSPSGQTSVISLTENTTDSPGNYSGSFSNITETGTYQVTYVISGQNSEGQNFDQTSNDQFVVTSGGIQSGSSSGGGYQSNKVFDINQENEVRVEQGANETN